MKKMIFTLAAMSIVFAVMAGSVEKTYTFGNYTIKNTGSYSSVSFANTVLSGLPGEPMLPYQSVSLLLPPGERAVSVEIFPEDETVIPGTFILYPQQEYRPISQGPSGTFLRNDKIYQSPGSYPGTATGHLLTQYLNGYAFAVTTFTPLTYLPAAGKVSYFGKVKVRINTLPEEKSASALANLTADQDAVNRVREFVQNPELLSQYPEISLKKTGYQMMIITPQQFQAGFSDLISYYASVDIEARVITTESIYSTGTGIDNQAKIRNAIIQEYQGNGIKYVLLGGGIGLVPYRGFYCYVESGSGYVDTDIPADLYYSGLDGNFDANGNQVYGEPNDEPDLLPDVAVGRFPFDDAAGLASMVHKTVSYQSSPVMGESKHPLMAGEFLTDSPPTWGGDYMDLLINNHTDNGYFTHGIPSATNTIETLYDTDSGFWTSDTLVARINRGTSFIHHLGHASTDYMLRLSYSDITNENFAMVDGIHHNYALLYTQGCYCGSFDLSDCISVKSVTIDNFLVAGIVNSRYGWFDQGFTEGPSEHLEREFVSALYTDTLPENHIGTTHMISKIKTAPWVTVPGEFEPGAQRWCHYCCNLLGDPALWIWTDEPVVGIEHLKNGTSFTVYPNPAEDKVFVKCTLTATTNITITILNLYGQNVAVPYEYSSQAKGEHTFAIVLPNLAAGVYLLKAGTLYSSETYKLTIR